MATLFPEPLRRQAREARWLLRRGLLPPDVRVQIGKALDDLAAGQGSRAVENLERLCRPFRPSRPQRLMELVFVLLILFLTLRSFFVQSFSVTSASMEPTLRSGGWEDLSKFTWTPPGWPKRTFDRLVAGVSYHAARAESSGTVQTPGPRRSLLGITWQSVQIGEQTQIIWFPPPMTTESEDLPAIPNGLWPIASRVDAGAWIYAGRFHRGDRILLDRLSYNFTKPKRDHIVILCTRGLPSGGPRPLEPFAVKRLIGLEGDRIGATQITGGQIFIQGDNTERSLDSRHWGPIQRDRVLGRVRGVYWPWRRNEPATP